jgi:hypothetical protein
MISSSKRETVGLFSEKVEPQFAKAMKQLREQFSTVHGIDPVSDVSKVLMHRNLTEEYDQLMFNDYQNSSLNEGANPFASAVHEANIAMFNQILENSKTALMESAGIGALRPVVGLTLPLLKRYWIENAYKDIVPTEVPVKPVFKVGIEKKYLLDKDGVKHYLPEAIYDSPSTILGVVQKSLTADTITVPIRDFDLITESGGSLAQRDSISVNFSIKSIFITVKSGTTGTPTTTSVEVKNLRVPVDQATGVFTTTVSAANLGDFATDAATTDVLYGSLDYGTGKLSATSLGGKITGLTVAGTLSNENNLTSASTGWEHEDKEFTIPDGIHLNSGMTVERMTDSQMLYNIDEASFNVKLMSETLTSLREVSGFAYLDSSLTRLANTSFVKKTTFNCKPPATVVVTDTYAWIRSALKETLDNVATELAKVLKNKNVRFVVYGNIYDIKLLDLDINWVYSTEVPMGGVKLNYKMGVMNKLHNFNIVSTDHCPTGKIHILVIPVTEEQYTYKNFEFNMIIANDYRDPNMPNVPSVMTTLRYLDTEVTPVQGEITIQNNVMSASDLYV